MPSASIFVSILCLFDCGVILRLSATGLFLKDCIKSLVFLEVLDSILGVRRGENLLLKRWVQNLEN